MAKGKTTVVFREMVKSSSGVSKTFEFNIEDRNANPIKFAEGWVHIATIDEGWLAIPTNMVAYIQTVEVKENNE